MSAARRAHPRRRRAGRSRWRWSASTSPPAAPPTRRRSAATPANRALAETSGGLEGLAESSPLGARRRRLPARRHRERSPGARHARRRERFTQRFHIDDAKLPRRSAPGWSGRSTTPKNTATSARSLAAPMRVTVEHVPLEQGIELVEDAEKFLTAKASSAGSATRSKNCCPERAQIARTGATGARARSVAGRAPDPEHRQRLQRQPRPERPAGDLARSTPGIFSGLTAM